MFKMFKWLTCKHEYKFYNTKVGYLPFSIYGHNVFQFVCPKCGTEVSVSETEIRDAVSAFESDYNRSLALGGKPVESSDIVIKRHKDCDILYSSPAVTLLLEHYRSKGIDLSQIDQQRRKRRGYSHSEGG